MKWEPVENAEKVLEDGETALCFIEYKLGDRSFSDFDLCERYESTLIPLDTERFFDEYRITHFMVIEEPNNENTNQAS